MADCETTDELLALGTRLQGMSDMIGWLCTNHRYRVAYPNNPGATASVQAQVDLAAEFINVTYVNAVLDEADFRPTNRWLTADQSLEFKAWVHVRHTGAHTPGGRARGYALEFDAYMTGSSAAMSGLRQNCSWSATSIALPYAMSHRFFTFAVDIAKSALGHCANGNVP